MQAIPDFVGAKSVTHRSTPEMCLKKCCVFPKMTNKPGVQLSHQQIESCICIDLGKTKGFTAHQTSQSKPQLNGFYTLF